MHFKSSGSALYPENFPAGVKIQPRIFPLDDYDSVPRLWCGGSSRFTHILNSLSVFIPEAERFMIRVMKDVQPQLENSDLKTQVRTFIHQEAHHYKVHDTFNKTLIKQGFSLDRKSRITRKLFDWCYKYLPNRFNLGITATMEHFTASVAHLSLGELEDFAIMLDPKMFDLWQWHAAEELEHKCVGYDVFNAAGGGFTLRLVTAAFTFILFGSFIHQMQFSLMRQQSQLEPDAPSLENKSLARLKFESVAKPYLFRLLKDIVKYFKPGFHPLQMDDAAQLQGWYKLHTFD